MDISVIIPTYKPGKYIEECLLSLKNQTYTKDFFEIIIILNGCSAPWQNDITDFLKRNNITNAKLIQTDICGVSNARNIGIENSTGEYVAFIDDDDYVSSEYLEELRKVAGKGIIALSDSLSFNDGENYYDTNYSMHQTYIRNKEKKQLPLMNIRHLLNGPCMKLIPREVIQDIRFNTSFRNGEDGLFIYEITRNVSQFKLAAETAIYYRRYRSNSAVTRRDSLRYIWKNAFSLSYVQTKILLKYFSKYNKTYSMVRIFASFKGAIYRSLNIK